VPDDPEQRERRHNALKAPSILPADGLLRLAGTWDAHAFDLLRRWLPSGLYNRLLYAGLPRVWEWGVDKDEE
jgi:hypothetical protein